ncbi:MAG TPA: hypothetical protein VMB79_10310, partial [Jatrophihabitans sp.]|nr:hypothetical protein [Jatrophihabitans sp.]
MAINTGLASLSEGLWTVATGTYMLAVVAYTGEYAFGRNGRIASTSQAPAREAVLVGAGAPVTAPAESRPYGAGVVGGSDAGRRWGRWAVGLTILGALVHLASVAIRGIAVDRVPWGN